ncbi:LIM domain transcription factor LMO4-B [Tetranychus urticae]|nr:LIM domain transcription factor LMO4-B [Tetranychus urticae]
MRLCSGCSKPIIDKYMWQIKNDDRFFHWNCLKCQCCQTILKDLCHVKDGSILCKEDYNRLCAPRQCHGCRSPIDSNKDWVIKIPAASNKQYHNTPTSGSSYVLYHLRCIRCCYCSKDLNPGDRYILNKANQTLVCTSSACLNHHNSTVYSSAVSSPYASSMPPSPLQPAPPQHPKMSVPSGRGRRGRGGGMYKKQ